MAQRDPAFLWETEALRSSGARTVAPSGSGQRWQTLREAHVATGIPIDTLRKWARKGSVPSFLDLRDGDPRRMVNIDAVEQRAADLGRPLGPSATAAASPPPSPHAPSGAGGDDVAAPPGTMIVPIAAWDKMLIQLGNLHEAGQDLAEARERAARAETEAAVLRERLSELRAAAPPPMREDGAHADTAASLEPSARAATRTWRAVSKRVYGAWRERRRR
ncbi:MAG: hypothetical protein ACE5GC_08875 [Acidimicrobiia bacterium]